MRDRFEGATKMKRKKSAGKRMCGRRALDVIGGWWSLLIIYEVYRRPETIGDFERNLGVAKNILATRLKALLARVSLRSRQRPMERLPGNL